MVTVSPSLISPPVASPVTVIVSPASLALITSSAVILSTLTVPSVALVSTVTFWVVEVVLPATSVTFIVKSFEPSGSSDVVIE